VRVTFDRHKHLLPIYADKSAYIAVRKGAQTGLTIWQLLRNIHKCLYESADVGFYFPTEPMLQKLVKTRLDPLLRENEVIKKRLERGSDSQGIKRLRNIHGGVSNLYLFHIGGTATRDSTPLTDVSIDEVRLCSVSDIEQVHYRTAARDNATHVYASTAGLPGENIDHLYSRGSRNVWLSRCNCQDGGISLASVWPDCIAVPARGVPFWRCPRCGVRIDDPQIGRYICENPSERRASYWVPGILGPKWSRRPDLVWDRWNDTTNRQEFYNAMLGLPWIDADSVPVTPEHLRACVNAPGWPAYNPDDGEPLRWGKTYRRGAKERSGCAMGVDQHGGNLYIVVLRQGTNGTAVVVHLEVVDTGNPEYGDIAKSPFVRLPELMREYDVQMAVTDAAPNFNEAAEFARSHPGRAFIAYYSESQTETVKWLDGAAASSRGRLSPSNVKWQVNLHRYKAIDESLSRIANAQVVMPDPRELVQLVYEPQTGRFAPEAVCQDRFWLHLRSVARDKHITNGATGEFKMRWRNIGLDPHFVHAYTYAHFALQRAARRPIFSFM
jgi:hypothetical protein